MVTRRGERKAGCTIGDGAMAAATCASVLPRASGEVVRDAEARGLVKPLPDVGLSTGMKRHAKRTVAWQLEQQIEGQRAQAQMGGRIATPAGTPAPILPAGDSGKPN